MNRQAMLRITLFISVLAFNPAVAQTLNQRTLNLLEAKEQRTLGCDIAELLVQRGLEKESAQRLSQIFIEKHSASMEKMAYNIVGSGVVSHSDMLAFLSEAALFRKEMDLSSYDTLVHMVSYIENGKPSSACLAKLQSVALQNGALMA